ncbi:F-box protein At5g65850-like [Brassica napus]|uniref:F-box protein At5g65850-like n=1 Tax=Brassica napus TaxID=3708 RepID=UPI002078AEA5|nr:F-box protein At5g65850-like [Brassica napus]
MSWRMLQCSIPHFYPRDEICVNGVLYYTSLYKACMIVCFDVRSEKFNLIEVKGASVRRAVLGFMVNCNGKLGFSMSENHEGNVGFISGKSSRFKLWVLEDVEKQECSERVYVLPAEWKNIVGEHVLKFVGLSRTNEIVLSSWYSVKPFYLFYFNPGRNTVVRVEIEGVDMDGSKFAVL